MSLTGAIDIFAFGEIHIQSKFVIKKKHPSALYCESVGTIVCFRGMCALEMTALELTDNGEKGGQVVSSHVFSIYSHHYVFYKFGIR